MDDVERGGAAGAETSNVGAIAAPGRERRMTAGRKQDAVLRGEPLEVVARELAVTAADLERLAGGVARGGCGGPEVAGPRRSGRNERPAAPRTRVGEPTMDTELLHAEIERLEAGGHPTQQAAWGPRWR